MSGTSHLDASAYVAFTIAGVGLSILIVAIIWILRYTWRIDQRERSQTIARDDFPSELEMQRISKANSKHMWVGVDDLKRNNNEIEMI